MNTKNLVVILLANREEPWHSIYQKGSLATWAKHPGNGTTVIPYFGSKPNGIQSLRERITGRLRHSKLYLLQILIDKKFSGLFRFSRFKPEFVAGVLYQKEPELHSTIGVRTLRAFESALELLEWDYLWRANVSNYVNTQVLYRLIQDLPCTKFAGGVINENRNTEFLSGAGYLLSRDVVEEIIKMRNDWNHSLPDDVALGLLLAQINVRLISIPRIDFINVGQVEKITNVQLMETPSYRCNTGNALREDVEIMRRLHQRIHDLGSSKHDK